jgi:hypothetical protein
MEKTIKAAELAELVRQNPPELEYLLNISRGKPIYGVEEDGKPLHVGGGFDTDEELLDYIYENELTRKHCDHNKQIMRHFWFYAAKLLGYEYLDVTDEATYKENFTAVESRDYEEIAYSDLESERGFDPTCIEVDPYVNYFRLKEIDPYSSNSR